MEKNNDPKEDEFWEKILKIFEKMAKEIQLFAKIFVKTAKEIQCLIHLFTKFKKSVVLKA